MLTLKNFEAQIGSAILQRGKKYYDQGKVINLEETDGNVWEADVQGSEIYSVEIIINTGNKVSKYECDCPYSDDLCKHVIAVLFALKDAKAATDIKKKTAPVKAPFENLLQKITVKEYQDFIRKYARGNKGFKTEFELYFSEKDDSIDVEKKYAGLIRKVISKHSDRGFINYYASSKLANGLYGFYAKANDFIKQNNFNDAIAIARPMLKASMEVITESDDSNGDLGGLIDDAIGLFAVVADSPEAARALKEQIFFFLKDELDNKIYFDYGDFGYEMLDVFKKLALQLGNTEQFLSFIDAALSKPSNKYSDYHHNFFQTQKISFLQSTGRINEAEKLIVQNLEITEVRQGEVDKAIAKKDYKLAKQLINDGIAIAQKKQNPGTVDQWKKELLRIAVLEKDTERVRLYTKYFAFDRWFDKEYYNQWKKTYPTSEWKAVIESHIDDTIKNITQKHELNKNQPWYQPTPPLLHTIAPVYIEEQYWDRLLALLKKENNLDSVLQYHQHIVKRYPSELSLIYFPLLEAGGDKANSRSDYADLVNKMKMIIKDIPGAKANIITIAQKLKLKYQRRPAMVDELNKILM